MSEKQYKPIGWVVECIGHCFYADTFRRTRKESQESYIDFDEDKRSGLIRLVRVYVEVKE